MQSAVLAGGASSRLQGRHKGLELVGGERILDRVVQSLKEATGKAPLLIANAPEAQAWRPDLRVVRDAIRDCGSLGGIYTALTAAEGPVLVVAWDMPFVPVELLQAIIERSEGHDACLPESDAPRGGLEPLCAVYGPACIEPVRRQIVEEDLRASGFLDDIRLTVLPRDQVEQYGDPATMFFNVNTEEDLETAQNLWRALSQ